MEIEVITRMQDTNLLHYIDGLYGYAMALTRNHAEAEGLVQETYVRAMQAMQKLRADSNIKGWLPHFILEKYLIQSVAKAEKCSAND